MELRYFCERDKDSHPHPSNSMPFPEIKGYTQAHSAQDSQIAFQVLADHHEKFLEARLDCWEGLDRRDDVEAWLKGGRTPHPVISVQGERWVIKRYLRGGWMAKINRNRYFSPDRFYREIKICAHAERSDVPTVPMIAMILKQGAGGAVQAWSVSPYIEEAQTLADVLSGDGVLDEHALFEAGAAVRSMHQAKIDHPDLNLRNILIVRDQKPEFSEKSQRALLLDWDKAQIVESGQDFHFKNLLRLFRSALKLRIPAWRLRRASSLFLRAYFQESYTSQVSSKPEADSQLSPKRKIEERHALFQYYRKHRLGAITLHKLFWKNES